MNIPQIAHLEQLETRSDPGRDPGDRVLATAYLALVTPDARPTLPADTAWQLVDDLPPTAFDHGSIIGSARNRLRSKLSYTNIGFAVAPETFTISQLRDTYAAALGHPVSATNLQRILTRRGVIEPTPDVARPTSAGGRPATVYRFAARELVVTNPFAAFRPRAAANRVRHPKLAQSQPRDRQCDARHGRLVKPARRRTRSHCDDNADRQETMTMTASMRNRRAGTVRLSAAVGVSLGAAALAACSSTSSSSSSAASSAPAASSASSTPTAGATGASASATALVITTKTSSAGAFLTSASGRAIYLWEKDGKDSSACSGGCASAWPPVTTTGSVTAAGSANKADLTTFTRSDGTKQVAYDGHPLYYFEGDTGAGEVTGQGSDAFGAKWYLVDPAGTAITAAAVTVSAPPRPLHHRRPGQLRLLTSNVATGSNVPTVGTPADRLPDETLLAGLGAGDAELSVAFVRRFQGVVFGVAVTVLHDRNLAEDVAQQAFERAWRHARCSTGGRGRSAAG